MVNIGKSVVIKGELSGSEDLTIEGQVEGKIELEQNVLTIGPNGKIKAQIVAKAVVVQGEVTGNITATERVDIRDNGSVDGDMSAPRVAIAEGAHFRGSIDMQKQAMKPGRPAAGGEQARGRAARDVFHPGAGARGRRGNAGPVARRRDSRRRGPLCPVSSTGALARPRIRQRIRCRWLPRRPRPTR